MMREIRGIREEAEDKNQRKTYMYTLCTAQYKPKRWKRSSICHLLRYSARKRVDGLNLQRHDCTGCL